MKFKNITENKKHFKLNGEWKTVEPQEEVDLPVCILENDPEMICLEEPVEPVEAEPVEAEPVEAEPVEAEPVEAEPVEAEPVKDGLSREEAFALNKKEQVEMLKELGLSSSQIRKLKSEELRVDKILELQ